MSDLLIAIPSKGRLKEKSEVFFADSGFRIRQEGGQRGYTAMLEGLPSVSVMLLSAREIAQGLIDGAFHVGITGEDLLHDLTETPGEEARLIRRLGFGHADVAVAVPKGWLDVSTMADLEAAGALFRERHGRRMKVATKYMRLTRRFFASRSVGEYRLVYSGGATEAAPASGSAELIVDITTTGATLAANGLKILNDGIMLRSEASLCGSRFANWNTPALDTLQTLLDGVETVTRGDEVVCLETSQDIPPRLVTEFNLKHRGYRRFACESDQAESVCQALKDQGYGSVHRIVTEGTAYSDRRLFEKFVAEL